MLRPWSRRRISRLVAACVVLFGVIAASGFMVVGLDQSQRAVGDQQLVFAEAAALRAHFEDELYGTFNLATGVQAYVTAYPELADRDRLDELLGTLVGAGKHIRNIGLAPNDVIEVVYPLEGNEAAVGLDYRTVPEQYASVEQARLIRQPVLDGPLDLVQGGRGLVSRTPVFRDDASYWGVATVVIDVDSVVRDVEEAAETDALPIDWAVRTWSNYGEVRPLTGDPALFGRAEVRLTFDVPDATWELVAARSEPGAIDGRAVALRVVAIVIAAVVALLVFEVVRERWKAIALSLHDPLTGLPNRRLLADRIEGAVASARRRDRPFAVAFIDLDRFKQVNDAHGHRAGDRLLQEVARRLEARTRATDTVARVGGDEFVLLLADADPDALRALVAELETAVTAPVLWEGQELRVGVSTGVAVYPYDGTDAQGLIQRADHGMYVAKRDGETVLDGV